MKETVSILIFLTLFPWRILIPALANPVRSLDRDHGLYALGQASNSETPPPKEHSPSGETPSWLNKIKISGSFEGDYRWMEYNNITDINSGASSDLYIRMLELAVESSAVGWVDAIAVLNSEWLGDYLNKGDEKITLDEVHFDIQPPDQPLFLVFGKRTQPSGSFENYLVTDPMTQDAYETKKVGITLGLNLPWNSSISWTAYKGREQMNHLFQSGLIDTGKVHMALQEVNKVSSYILSGSISPSSKYLIIFGAFQSEPGLGKRNNTLNLGFHSTLPFHRNVVVEGEYMKALDREKYQGSNRSFRESVLSLTSSYLFVLRERKFFGGGTYRGRKSQKRSHPIEVAARYEFFGDNGMSREFNTWAGKGRYSFGGRYSFYEDKKAFIYAMFEYRRSSYLVPQSLKNAVRKNNNEVYLRMGIDF